MSEEILPKAIRNLIYRLEKENKELQAKIEIYEDLFNDCFEDLEMSVKNKQLSLDELEFLFSRIKYYESEKIKAIDKEIE